MMKGEGIEEELTGWRGFLGDKDGVQMELLTSPAMKCLFN